MRLALCVELTNTNCLRIACARDLTLTVIDPYTRNLRYGSQFIDSYYEAMLSGAITFRSDQKGDCFATRADTDALDACDDAALEELQRQGDAALSSTNQNMAVMQPWHNNVRVCCTPLAI